MFNRIIEWIISLFIKLKPTPFDKNIEKKKDSIQKIDKKLEDTYDSVDESMKEWK